MHLINRMFILAVLTLGNVYGVTHEGIIPILKYQKGFHLEHKNLDSKYLVVVPEEWSFPQGKQRVRFERALEILPDIMNSDSFKTKVLSYVNSRGKREYQKNYLWTDSKKRMTNEEILNLIYEGNEKMLPSSYGEMNINSRVRVCGWWKRKFSTWCRNVIGSTNPYSSKWITVNWKFYSRYKTSQMVSNLVHEWLHLLGFLHGKVNMREEVPYVVGAIAGEVASDLLKEYQLPN